MAFRNGALALFSLLLVAAAGQAQAGDSKPVSVVELFTSQGCSSCPPADAFMHELIKRNDVVALAYHVDYWDYLGWKDTFASAENTRRQRAYREALKSNSVYTPQAVINGRAHAVGSRTRAVDAQLAKDMANGLSPDVPVSIERTGNMIKVTAGASDGPIRDAQVVLVYFRDATDVPIARGENHGRTISYVNTVSGWQTVGMWHGDAVSFELPEKEIEAKGKGGCAVLLQAYGPNGTPGPILGAAILNYHGS